MDYQKYQNQIKKIMNREFLQNIAPLTAQFKRITIDISQMNMMETCTQKLLNVPNRTALGDMYEGEAFRSAFIIRTSTEIALEKLLDVEVIDWDQKSSNKSYIPIFVLEGEQIELFSSSYGYYPLISQPKSKNIIIALYRDPRVVLFCGYINSNLLVQNVKKGLNRRHCYKNHLGYFSKFEILTLFNNLDELKKLIR